MAQAARHPQWSSRLLTFVALMLLIFSLTPTRFTGWLAGLGGFVERVVTPVSHPASWLAGVMAGGARASSGDAAVDELARYETLARRLSAENERLRLLIQDLQAGVAYASRPVVPVVASVIARSSDPSSPALTVRAGRSHGVEVSDVAVVRGIDIVGRVERVSSRTALVRPITDRSGGPIDGVVDVSDGGTLRCQLEPTGPGVLSGPLISEYLGDEREPRLPEVGALVRLSDSAWPESAQMLVIGRVTEVVPDPEQPLRYTATVSPRAELSRVAELIVRTSPEPSVSGEGGER
ncbi:MAG: rod shape-determining protein MreC [Planctomycetota bacterium]